MVIKKKKISHKVQVQQTKVIHIEENRVQLSDGTWLEAAHIVLANGIHATDFPELPIEPKKKKKVIWRLPIVIPN